MSDKMNSEKKSEKETKPINNEEAKEGEKSKADLRRERRAIQEAQRAKKEAVVNEKKPSESAKSKPPVQKQQPIQQQTQPKQPQVQLQQQPTQTPTPQETKQASPTRAEQIKVVETTPKPSLKPAIKATESSLAASMTNLSMNKSKLFHHFEQYKRDYSIVDKFGLDNPSVHPAFIKLGLEYAHDRISGSNSRCMAFLNALKQFINDYKLRKKEKTLAEDLEAKLKPNINYLAQCRPLSISMGNAIKEIKQVILHLPKEITESEAKKILHEEIDQFIDEKILLAWDTISKYLLANSDIIISGTSYAKSKITNDDCILIYSCSSLVTHVLIEASRKFPNMKVIIVDSRPKLKGRKSLEQLVKHGINCTYVLINGIGFVMNKVTKVILGAHALLANGYVMSAIGSSQIALVAKSFNVPVVICCETYKFCDKVQTDALVNNELCNPLDLLSYSSAGLSHVSPLAEWSPENKELENINILSLTYDITPPEFINCVVTDMGMLPCTSVPVVLRLKNRDNLIVGKKSITTTHSKPGDSNKNER